MSAFEWNKIIGAVLAALLVIKVVDIAGDSLLHAKAPGKHAYPVAGIAPAQPSTAGEPKKAEIKIAAIAPMLAGADAKAGAQAARKCTVCHSFDKGAGPKVGPALWGVVGRDVASGSFSYSPALKGVGGKWDYEALNKYIYDPKLFAPGNRMAFAGIKNDAERAALIAYLRGQSDSPAPLP